MNNKKIKLGSARFPQPMSGRGERRRRRSARRLSLLTHLQELEQSTLYTTPTLSQLAMTLVSPLAISTCAKRILEFVLGHRIRPKAKFQHGMTRRTDKSSYMA
jgi:hypothetical protein